MTPMEQPPQLTCTHKPAALFGATSADCGIPTRPSLRRRHDGHQQEGDDRDPADGRHAEGSGVARHFELEARCHHAESRGQPCDLKHHPRVGDRYTTDPTGWRWSPAMAAGQPALAGCRTAHTHGVPGCSHPRGTTPQRVPSGSPVGTRCNRSPRPRSRRLLRQTPASAGRWGLGIRPPPREAGWSEAWTQPESEQRSLSPRT
jgi:hypothetical protein